MAAQPARTPTVSGTVTTEEICSTTQPVPCQLSDTLPADELAALRVPHHALHAARAPGRLIGIEDRN